MAETLADVAITNAWVDLTVADGALSGATAAIQNKGPGVAFVNFTAEDAEPAHVGNGYALNAGDGIRGTAAHIWVMSGMPSGVLAVGLADS